MPHVAGGYHHVRVGEQYKDGQYTVLKKLGWGHFSTVWLVNDRQTGHQLAMKVQKSAPHYTDAAYDEIELLTAIRDADPSQDSYCVHLLDSFTHRGPHGSHVCMVFEALGENLLAVIKRFHYRGLPIPLVRRLSVDMLRGLDLLHRYPCPAAELYGPLEGSCSGRVWESFPKHIHSCPIFCPASNETSTAHKEFMSFEAEVQEPVFAFLLCLRVWVATELTPPGLLPTGSARSHTPTSSQRMSC